MRLILSLILVNLGLIYASPDDIYLDVPEMVKKNGYPIESHKVYTADGFILTVHRIPHGKNSNPNRIFTRPPILLQHGLLASSACWLLGPVEKAPGYVFADAGYDVWLGNARGNYYSKNNTRYNDTTYAFWDFSFDEMGKFDLPAVFDHILNTTGHPSIAYVGHSMGTTMFFSFLAQHPRYTKKVRVFFGLAPVARVSHIKAEVLTGLSKWVYDWKWAMLVAGQVSIPHNHHIIELAEKLCTPSIGKELLCETLIFALTGSDYMQLNRTWLPSIISHSMEGASVRTIVHYAQGILTGEFSYYDFGKVINYIYYGQSTAPVYDLTNINVPTILFWSNNDFLADPQDVKWLSRQLPNIAVNYKVPVPWFNHLDFIWAKDADKLIYRPILKYLKHF